MGEKILLTFCNHPKSDTSYLNDLSNRQWKKLLHWLDVSGLALYFYDRLLYLNYIETIPVAIRDRLNKNLTDNVERTRGMLAELDAIQSGLRQANVQYAILKGFSLWPHSVPRPELRSQLDLDFLIAPEGIEDAVQVLKGRGYHLFAQSGNSWEFKIGHMGAASLKTLYKPVMYGCVELHVAADPRRSAALARVETLKYESVCMSVLAPADLFLGQGLHVFKHICGESSRTSHLLEFWRHVSARRHDKAFWEEVRVSAEAYPRVGIELGIVLLLATKLMGEFAPNELTCWTMDTLPPYARLWVDLYGPQAVLCGSRGSKFYLFLQRELVADGAPAPRTVLQSLVPKTLPKLLVYRPDGEPESMKDRIGRYRIKFQVLSHRLRFHLVENARYLLHAASWRRHMAELGRS